MNNNHYWKDKDKRAKIAKEHTSKMRKFYKEEIENCVKKTITFSYAVNNPLKKTNKGQKIILTDEDSVSALFNFQEEKTCVLNFASYKNPGGMFLKGSKAQEECLCHESFLYNVLREFDNTYYAHNRAKLNRSLYTNQALYSPDVRFIHNGKQTLADVLTCAAPNYSSAEKYCKVSQEENLLVLKDRIKFVLNIASNRGVNTLILGAWGCGVFSQDPYKVARYFHEELDYHQDIEKIVFAVTDKKSENYKAFSKILGF